MRDHECRLATRALRATTDRIIGKRKRRGTGGAGKLQVRLRLRLIRCRTTRGLAPNSVSLEFLSGNDNAGTSIVLVVETGIWAQFAGWLGEDYGKIGSRSCLDGELN